MGERLLNTEETAAPLLVIGCGNVLAGDDSAGIEIVRRLRERPVRGCLFQVVEYPGPQLLDALEQARGILLVDAVTSGAAPGTVLLAPLAPGCLDARMAARLSTHGWGLPQLLDLARALGRHIPPLVLLGVEIETVSPGAPRSPAVDEAVSAVVDAFPLLCELLLTPGRRLTGPVEFAPGQFHCGL